MIHYGERKSGPAVRVVATRGRKEATDKVKYKEGLCGLVMGGVGGRKSSREMPGTRLNVFGLCE